MVQASGALLNITMVFRLLHPRPVPPVWDYRAGWGLWTSTLPCFSSILILIWWKTLLQSFAVGIKIKFKNEISWLNDAACYIKQVWQQSLTANQWISSIFTFTQQCQAQCVNAHVNSSCCWERSLSPASRTMENISFPQLSKTSLSKVSDWILI